MSPPAVASIWNRFSRRKQLGGHGEESRLDRCLTTFDLTALGIGSTLGVGIYVLSGSVARNVAGPSVVLSFFVAGVASALSGICYAELGARVPRAGSAYVYSYTTVGELIAFIIGWNLILEYVIGTASVARGYSGYLDSLLNKQMAAYFRYYLPIDIPYLSPYPDLCAFTITLLLTFILSIGVKESTRFNNVFTCLNLAVVVFVTGIGLFKSNPANWNLDVSSISSNFKPGYGGFFPFGIHGTLAGAATCFFGYVGFDAIATSGEETKDPQKSIPIAICLSLFFVFLAYFGVSSTLTLMVPYYLQDPDSPLPHAFHAVGWDSAAVVVTIGALFGLSTSLLGAMFPLPRVLYAMASDGLIPRFLSRVHSSTQTPLIATIVSGTFAGFMAAIFDLKNLVDMMSIGTLMAYTIVAACVILLRYQDIPGLAPPSGKEYFPLGSVAEKTPVLPTLQSTLQSDSDSEDDEIVCYRSEELDTERQKLTTEEDDLNLSSCNASAPARDPGLQSFSDFFLGLLNIARQRAPSRSSSTIASVLTVVYSFLATVMALILQHENAVQHAGLAINLVIGVLVFFMILSLICLSLQPKTTQVISFKVPLVPLLPGVSIFVNVYLMMKLPTETWVRFFVWMLMGFSIYFGYGWRNSSEEYRMLGKKPPKPDSLDK